MKQYILKALLGSALMAISLPDFAQNSWNEIRAEKNVSCDTITRKGFTLVFINQDKDFSPVTRSSMIEAFFKVYPKQAALYNARTLKKVVFIIDPQYDGVAATSGEIVRYSPLWMRNNPNDIDVVTHEVMHIIQSYPDGAGPGWITEGIADYVRHTTGVDNEAAGWRLPEYKANHKYTDAYRVTASFFVWIEKNKKKGFVKALDKAMRTKTYTSNFWKDKLGKTVDELWKEYSESSKTAK